MNTDFLLKNETDAILSAFFTVYTSLGYGFLERVYQNALFYELQQRKFKCEAQRHLEVYFKGMKVGDYYPDIIVNDQVILELKTVESIRPEHEAQLLNYLRSTKIEVGLLLNFGLKPQFKRLIYTNDRKKSLCSSVPSV